MKKALKILSINFVLLFIGLLLMEALARTMIANPILMNRFHEAVSYDEFTTRSLRPNAVFYHESLDGRREFRTNSFGFRMDREPLQNKEDSVIRVLVLGDSHAQGMDVNQNETFSERLNDRSCAERKIEVINTGISGSGTSEHLILLHVMLGRLKPDIVIEAFYPNDLLNNDSAFHKLVNGKLELTTVSHPALKGLKILKWHNDIYILSWLSQNSYLYSTLLNYGWEVGKKILGVNQKEKGGDSEKLQYDGDFKSRQIDLFNAIISDMNKKAVQSGAKFYVINIPDLNQKRYDLNEVIHTENIELAHKIRYPESKELHVKHGSRHINAGTHQIISDDLYKLVCSSDGKKIH